MTSFAAFQRSGSAALYNAEAVFKGFFVIAYCSFPAELLVQPIGFGSTYFRTFKDHAYIKKSTNSAAYVGLFASPMHPLYQPVQFG